MSGYTNINGKLFSSGTAFVPADNRAFRYGYGLFETLLVEHGQIVLKDNHFDRLFAGMSQLHFSLPGLFTRSFLEEQIAKTVAANKLEQLCRVRLQVFAGAGGLLEANDQSPQWLIESFPLSPTITGWNENGLILGIATGIQKSADQLANLKTSNALVYAMAAIQARQEKWNDALIRNTAGHIIESTIANIFWIKEETIYTPPLSEGCIAGVMRRHLLDLLTAKGIHIAQIPLTDEQLQLADEVFLTNAIRRIKWVKSIGDRQFGCVQTGKLARSVFG